MKRFFKVLGILVALLLVLVLGWSAYVYSIFSDMAPDRGEDYQSRMHYLPNPEPAAPGELKGFAAWSKQRLHNELVDRGPYIVAFPIEAGAPKTAVIVLPGGGYLFRSEKQEGLDIAEWLNSEGIAAFVLNYRLNRQPTPLKDAQTAIRYVRENAAKFNIDAGKLGVMGFSAGGHLAATAATKFTADTRPDFTALNYPVITMTDEYTHGGSRDGLLGLDPDAKLIADWSAEQQVTTDTPPVFVWIAKTDTVVPWQNAQLMADALAKHGVEHELHIFPEGKHGSALAQNEAFANAWPALFIKWLKKLEIKE